MVEQGKRGKRCLLMNESNGFIEYDRMLTKQEVEGLSGDFDEVLQSCSPAVL